MAVEQRTMTAQEFMAIAQLPENASKRLELIEGVIVEMPGSSPENSAIAIRVAYHMTGFVLKGDLGHVTGADGGYALGPRDVRIPDVAFVSKERVPKLTGSVVEGPPDLAVEVVSPSESARDVMDKARAYLKAGARLVWAIYPEARVVDVIRLTPDDHLDVETIGVDGVLDGADVLPGFRLAVKDVFAE